MHANTPCRFLQITCLFFCAALANIPASATDANAKFNASNNMVQNLRSFTGQKVFVTLSSGTTVSGTVQEVGNELLHLSELTGKEFFDSIIRVDHISAVDARRN